MIENFDENQKTNHCFCNKHSQHGLKFKNNVEHISATHTDDENKDKKVLETENIEFFFEIITSINNFFIPRYT